MSTSVYDTIDLDTAYKNRHRECPSCNQQTVQRSADCLNEVNEDNFFNSETVLAGVYCTECGWFELDRDTQPQQTTTGTTQTDTCGHTPEAVHLTDGREIPLSDKRVHKVNKTTVIFTDENACPECGDSIKIEATNNHGDDSKIFRPVKQVCKSYHPAGKGCNHKTW
jgi:predicted RNA-binding Zn-ribbon protein involved in translation (DUF1610 family)